MLSDKERKELRDRHNKQLDTARKSYAALSSADKKKKNEASANMQRKVQSSIEE